MKSVAIDDIDKTIGYINALRDFSLMTKETHDEVFVKLYNVRNAIEKIVEANHEK